MRGSAWYPSGAWGSPTPTTQGSTPPGNPARVPFVRRPLDSDKRACRSPTVKAPRDRVRHRPCALLSGAGMRGAAGLQPISSQATTSLHHGDPGGASVGCLRLEGSIRGSRPPRTWTGSRAPRPGVATATVPRVGSTSASTTGNLSLEGGDQQPSNPSRGWSDARWNGSAGRHDGCGHLDVRGRLGARGWRSTSSYPRTARPGCDCPPSAA